MTEKLLQWHPAFFAGIQIEFGEEAKYLEFKSEYVLGTKPMMIIYVLMIFTRDMRILIFIKQTEHL